MVAQEMNSPNERIIYSNDDFILLAPFAARYPYEMWIIPIKHSHIFSGDDKIFDSLALVFKEFIVRMNAVLYIPSYNFVIHSGPLDGKCDDFCHWHIEIRPRISSVSGFEWGSGTYKNAVLPEDAALELREVEVHV